MYPVDLGSIDVLKVVDVLQSGEVKLTSGLCSSRVTEHGTEEDVALSFGPDSSLTTKQALHLPSKSLYQFDEYSNESFIISSPTAIYRHALVGILAFSSTTPVE